MSVEATHPVDDVMRRWPVTIRVFLKHRMHCVGCPITCFHTVRDACREHNVDEADFMAELAAVIAKGPISADEGGGVTTVACWPG